MHVGYQKALSPRALSNLCCRMPVRSQPGRKSAEQAPFPPPRSLFIYIAAIFPLRTEPQCPSHQDGGEDQVSGGAAATPDSTFTIQAPVPSGAPAPNSAKGAHAFSSAKRMEEPPLPGWENTPTLRLASALRGSNWVGGRVKKRRRIYGGRW